MEKTTKSASASQNQIKVPEDADRTKIIEAAVKALFTDQDSIEHSLNGARAAEASQLAALTEALKDYPIPVTEKVWRDEFRSKVVEHLDQLKPDGSPRYKNSGSRDVIVNQMKVATMGLTLARQDTSFKPGADIKSLKRYYAEVRGKLQAAIDPDTGNPRLRSAPPRSSKPKVLPEGTLYLLIGCENAKEGLRGSNTVLAADTDLHRLERQARKAPGQYEKFMYCVTKLEDFNLDAEEPEELPLIQNATVFTTTISSKSNSLTNA